MGLWPSLLPSTADVVWWGCPAHGGMFSPTPGLHPLCASHPPPHPHVVTTRSVCRYHPVSLEAGSPQLEPLTCGNSPWSSQQRPTQTFSKPASPPDTGRCRAEPNRRGDAVRQVNKHSTRSFFLFLQLGPDVVTAEPAGSGNGNGGLGDVVPKPRTGSPTFPWGRPPSWAQIHVWLWCLHLRDLTSSRSFLLVKAKTRVTPAPWVHTFLQPRESGGLTVSVARRQVQNEAGSLNIGIARTQRPGEHGQPTPHHCPGMPPVQTSDRTQVLPCPATFTPTPSSKQNHSAAYPEGSGTTFGSQRSNPMSKGYSVAREKDILKDLPQDSDFTNILSKNAVHIINTKHLFYRNVFEHNGKKMFGE